MSTKKWGEAFLKTGLPLKHLTVTELSAAGWYCAPKWEYPRANRDHEVVWFEVDLVAYAPFSERGELTILTECKYHDGQRSWIFLPCGSSLHAQYGALSAGGDPESDSEVVHHGPYDPLLEPLNHTLIKLAPQSTWGVNISQTGAREENTLDHALQQLSYAYVPFCLEHAYSFCKRNPEAILPAVVTTAKLFRLRATAAGIEAIRSASSPREIADEMPWTWCYSPPSGAVLDHNHDEIENWRQRDRYVHSYPGLDERLAALWSGPRWFAIINADHITIAYRSLQKSYEELQKNFSPSTALGRMISKGAKLARESTKRSKKK